MACRIRKLVDWIAIAIGVIAIVTNFAISQDSAWIVVSKVASALAAISCVAYGFYVFVLLAFRRPRFDWHLINGHFLRKVCCLVILTPSLLAVTGECFHIVDSSKELTFDENLFEPADNKLPCKLKREQENPNIFWSTYYHFIDPGNQHMTTTKAGRIWAAVIAMFGVFLMNGLLVSSIIGWVDTRKEKWLKGEVRYTRVLKRERHYVIIGGNDMVEGLVKMLLGNPEKLYILIQTSRDVESFRRELFSNLTPSQQKRIIIYYGNRNSSEDIEKLHIEKAEEVYVIGEDSRTDDIESYHDTMNMECLDLLLKCYKTTEKGQKISEYLPAVKEYRAKLKEAGNDKARKKEIENSNTDLIAEWGKLKGTRLKCRVMFEYQTTFSVFQFYDIDEGVDAYIDFRPFNYYELLAQKVFINREIRQERILDQFHNNGYLPLEGATGIKKDSEDHVHLFVVGMSRMGVAMAVEAAHLAHYPNFEEKKIRTKITFIDKNAAQEREFFVGRFKELFKLSHYRYGVAASVGKVKWLDSLAPSDVDYLGGDFLDIEWEFIEGGIEQSAIQDYIMESATPDARITIAICLPESNRAHASALYLHKKIYESDSVKQVLVYNRYGGSVIDAVSRSHSVYPYRGKLRSFGSAGDCFEDNILELTERVGEKIGQFYDGDSPLSKPVYDNSGKSKSACMWSNIYNGSMLWTKLRCVDYNKETFENDEAALEVLAKVEHNRWNIEQLLMNFRYVTREEQDIAIMTNNANKNTLKHQVAHLNICSNKRLSIIDKGAMSYDMGLTRCLSRIYLEEIGNL